MDAELKEYLEGMSREIRAEIAAAKAESRQQFGVMTEHLESQIRQVAEGVLQGNERADRIESRVGHIESRLDRLILETRLEFADIRSLIRDSYDAVDRRVSALENNKR